jgi:hypothetical protein
MIEEIRSHLDDGYTKRVLEDMIKIDSVVGRENGKA